MRSALDWIGLATTRTATTLALALTLTLTLCWGELSWAGLGSADVEWSAR